ncbi:glycosyltransferase involved in cell wall biosynthesis [Paenibacillus taihuensis]|uniref:Glycosyltransferase involved in cell wall biosynthesis n=1 Tax=Paenibacillus taihuensis TaxID=1156355 RepID=A0A3D9SEY2_9BACL|nr:glycosyltransferase family 4 protein [Paenibacillus taihuensis]REE93147.1 glycosyltransferase involved in cell wall biosynthesis [Paenibacillus taihuensis]
MRILIATYWGLPSLGGLDQYVRQLKRGLEARGHEVDIFCKAPDDSGYQMLNKGLFLSKSSVQPMISAKADTCFAKHLPGLDQRIKDMEIDKYCYEAAAAYLCPQPYDIIHTQDVVSARAFTRIGHSQSARVSTIHGCLATESLARFRMDGWLNDNYRSTPLWHYYGLIEHFGIIQNHETIMPTGWLKGIYSQEYQVPADRMTIVPYGMDIEEFLNEMNQPSVTPHAGEKKIILCSARFDPVKGHVHLLGALSQLKNVRDDWVCWLAGEGALEERLREQVAAFGLQNDVVFLGKRGDIPALLKKSDVVVLPSLQDNHPFAIMEAQVAGKPLIASNAGGIPEMVTQESTGLIFPAGNDHDLFRNLLNLLNNEWLRSWLSEQSQAWSQRYWSLPVMIDRIAAVYELALQKSRR